MRWRRAVAVGFLGSLGLAVSALIALQTRVVQSWIADTLSRQISASMTEGELRLDAFRLRGLRRVQAGGLSLVDADGQEHLGLEELALVWSPWSLLGGEVVIEELEVSGLELQLLAEADGSLGLLNLFPAGEDTAEGSSFAWSVAELNGSDLRVVYTPYEGSGQGVVLEQVQGIAWGSGADWGAEELTVSGHTEGERAFAWTLAGGLTSVAGDLMVQDVQVETPYLGLGVRGRLDNQNHLNLEGRLSQVDLEQLGVGVGRFGGDFRLLGPKSWTELSLGLTGEQGELGEVLLDGHLALEGEEELWSLALTTRDLRLAAFAEGLDEQVAMSGQLFAHGKGYSWPDGLSAELYALLDKPLSFGDQQLATLELQGHLADGQLAVASLESAIPGSASLQGFGDLDLIEGGVFAKLGGDIVPGQFGVGGSGRVSATISGNAFEQQLDVDGSVWLHRPSWGEGLKAKRVSASGSVNVEEGVFRFNGRGSGRGIDAYGALIDSLDLPELRGEGADGRTEVSWAGDLNGLHWGKEVHGESVRMEGSLVVGEASQSLDLSGVIGSVKVGDFVATNGAMRIAQRDDELSLFLDLLDDGRGMLSVEAVGDLQAQRMRLPRFLLAPTARLTWSGSGEEVFNWTDTGLTGVQFAIASAQGAVSLRGDIDEARPLSAQVALTDFSLDVLAELFPEQAGGLAGKITAEASLSGTSRDPQVVGSLDGERLWLPGVSRALDVDAQWELSDAVLRSELQASLAEEVLLRLSADLPIHWSWPSGALRTDAPLACELVLPPSSIGKLRPLVPALDTWPDGRLGGAISVGGRLDAPDIKGNGVVELKLPRMRDTARIEWGLRQEADRLLGTLGAYLGTKEQLRAQLDAESFVREQLLGLVGEDAVSPGADWIGEMKVTGQLSKVDVVDALVLSGNVLPLTGLVEGEFVAEGSPQAPSFSADMKWTDGRLGREPFEEARLILRPKPGGNEVDLKWRFNDEAAVQITGDVPVAFDSRRPREEWFPDGMALAVEGPGVPLGIVSLLDPGVAESDGLIRLWGAIGGRLLEPRGRLTVRAREGSLVYRPLNLRIDQMDLSADLTEEALTIKGLAARTLPSRDWLNAVVEEQSSVVKLSGTVGLDGAIDGDVRFENAWLAAKHNLRLRIDGGLVAKGDWPALKVVGSPGLDLVQGKIALDATAFVDQSALSLDPAIRTHRGVSNRREVKEERSWMDELQVRIPLSLNRNLETDITMPFVEDMGGLGAVVSSMNLTARLGSVQSGEGQLVLSMNEGELSMKGDVDVIEGKISVLQSRFNLTEGALRYPGGPAHDPDLDITGEASSSYDLTVQVTGTPGAPQIALSSETYPDTAEQMTILLTGRAPADLTRNEGEFVASSLAGMLLNSVFSNLEIGSLSVESDGSIRVGAPLSDKLYAESLLNFQPDLGDNHVTLQLEWTILSRLLMLTSLGEEKSGLDVMWEYRF
jgi:hypothetical protein